MVISMSPEATAKLKADQEARAKKEQEKRDAKKNQKVDFVRRDTRQGIYTTTLLGKKIKIKGREHYYTRNKKEIDFFNADPEIVIFDPGTPNKKK